SATCRSSRVRPLLIGATSILCIAWAGAAAAQEVEPPAVVRTLDISAADAAAEGSIAAPSPPPPEVVLPEVAPIIDDEEFEKAIPSISAEDDPELDRPLESIADFERRQAAEAARRSAGETASEGEAIVEAAPPTVDG